MNTMTVLPPGQPIVEGNTYPVERPAGDQAAARRFLASVQERVDTRQKIDRAVVEYQHRVARNQPYEDLVNADEFRARYGA